MLRLLFFWRCSPALVAVGLLALLLWGQCGGGTTAKSERPALGAEIARTDSLASRPITLFLTVLIANNTHQPLLLREASGTLQFSGQAWPFADSTQFYDELVPARSARRFHLSIPVAGAPAALRAALAMAPEASGLRLAWRVSYASQRQPQVRRVAYYYTTLPALNSVR